MTTGEVAGDRSVARADARLARTAKAFAGMDRGGEMAPVRRDGDIMVFVAVGIIFVAFFIAFFVSTIVRQESRMTTTYIDGVVALYLAESGVDQALHYLKKVESVNTNLQYALARGETARVSFQEPFYAELGELAPPDGKAQFAVQAVYEPDTEQVRSDVNPLQVSIGKLTVRSRATYTNPQQGRVSKQVKVVTKVLGSKLLMPAPEHGFFLRDPRVQYYQVPSFTLDARDFSVYGGNVYIENGMDIELTEYLMSKEFRPLREVGFMDLGYDTFNLFTLFNGGVNFTHSQAVEYYRNSILRRYFKFQGLAGLLGPGPAYLPVAEPYRPFARQVPLPPSNEQINLYSAEQYKKMANTVVEPPGPGHPDGNPDDTRYFTNMFFPGPLDLANTVYRNVLPLYGWGDWRKVPPWMSPDPTRKDDLSNAINLDGVTFVRGDVFLEGWYRGVGALVVQGNVYLGGQVIGVPPELTGSPSLMSLIVLEDPDRETMGPSSYIKNTGRVIFKPHMDTDFDRAHINVMREMHPYVDGSVYAKNGLATDHTSFLSDFFNLEIEFNLAMELFDWQQIPNDVRINGTDPLAILTGGRQHRGQATGSSPTLNPSFSIEQVSWEEEAPSL